jgi:hypothetical protein
MGIGLTSVACDDERLTVALTDGRRLSMPLSWYPRLSHGTPAERNEWRLIGGGDGVHWPALNEDLSVDGFLAGRRSQESAASVKRWLASRKAARPVSGRG